MNWIILDKIYRLSSSSFEFKLESTEGTLEWIIIIIIILKLK